MDEYAGISALMYDALSTGLEGDAAFYVEEARRAGSPVLELGCGTGRITAQVAAAGIHIVGLDRSREMLAAAARKVEALPADVRGRIRLVEGDMRAFSLAERFALIMVPYRAFLHLLTVEDQRAALECMRNHLAPGGRIALNIFDPRLDIIHERTGGLGSGITFQAEIRHPVSGRRVLVWDSRAYDPASQRLEMYWIYEELDDAGAVIARHYAPLTLRWIYRYEMEHLFALAGLRVEALYGDFERGPFRYGGEQIWVARRD